MAHAREAALWLAMLWSGALPRRQAKEIIRHWLDAGHMRLSELFHDLDSGCQELGYEDWEGTLESCRAYAGQADQRLMRLAEHGVDLVTRPDIAFPGIMADRLGERGVPYAMFFAGDLGVLSESFVAIMGATAPEKDAANLTSELAQSISGAGYHLVGGYARGADRLTMDAAQDQAIGNVIVVPLGIESFLPTLDRWNLPDEGGSRLVLSPYQPDAKPSEALSSAREQLVAALADVVVLIAPDRSPQDTPWWQDARSWGMRVLIWSGSDANIARAWIEQGAQVFDNSASLRSLLSGEEQESKWPSDAELGVKPLEPFEDAEDAIATLGSMGHVPEVLAKRLRDSEYYQHDPDPWLGDDQDDQTSETAIE